MATRAYTSGNYFYLHLDGVNEPFNDSKSNVNVWHSNETSNLYYIQGNKLGSHKVLLSDLQDESGTPYNLASWTAFYEANTGFSRASASEAGWFDYNDSATATTPITITGGAGFIDLTNDGLGAFTNKNYPPLGVTDVYDVDNDRFDFSQFKLGDMIDIRLDLEVTTTSTNTEVNVYLLLADGGSSYTIPFTTEQNYKNSGTYNINRFNGVYMGDANTLDNFGKFQMSSDKTCTVVVRGWYCKITRK